MRILGEIHIMCSRDVGRTKDAHYPTQPVPLYADTHCRDKHSLTRLLKNKINNIDFMFSYLVLILF